MSTYKAHNLVRSDTCEYIEVFYNRARRHIYLGQISPETCEKAQANNH